MSQKKVDAYKKEKANRKQAVAQKKKQQALNKVIVAIVCVIFGVWIGYSIIRLIPTPGNSTNATTSSAENATSNFDQDELKDLLSRLDAATDTDAE